MHTATSPWYVRAENWLDERGKGAWMAAMVLGFIFFWPVGLFLLAYMIWSKNMFTCANKRTHHRGFDRAPWKAHHSSGNSAFDAYKADTLRRLEEEQEKFQDFLTRLRDAKDKAEFDEFMDERARAARDMSDDKPVDL